jgi:RND family efflux transporter MFP subunit
MSTKLQGSDGHENGHPDTQHSTQPRISIESNTGTGRVLAFAVAVLAILLAVGFTVAYLVRHHNEDSAETLAKSNSDAKPVVDVVAVEPTAKNYPLQLPGQTAGWYQSTIFARVDGYVGTWSADIGDRVKQGQVLATIDTPEMDQQLNAAKAKAAASAAQVTVAESSVSIAKLTYDRWKDSPKGVVSEQEREEKKATFEEANARLTAAKAQQQLDEADVGRYSAMEEFKKVTAPYDGVITARHLDVGDLVSAGSSANTSSLYSIAQSNVIRVFVDVPQKAAADMIVGLGAQATSDQFPDRLFRGKVARSAMSIDPQTRTQRTEVDIPNPDLALVPGMYVQVTFQLNQRGLLEVPAAAILFRSAGLQVAVVGEDGKVDFRPVTVAKDNGDTVILASGVKAGDRVALNISSAVTPGSDVTVNEDKDNVVATPPSPQPAPTVDTTGSQNGELPADHLPAPDSGVHPPAPAKAPTVDPAQQPDSDK